MWFSALGKRIRNLLKRFFFKENDSWVASWGFPGDGGTGDSRRELPPLALNHVESKWACAIPARVLAQKDPSTRRNRWL